MDKMFIILTQFFKGTFMLLDNIHLMDKSEVRIFTQTHFSLKTDQVPLRYKSFKMVRGNSIIYCEGWKLGRDFGG
jgi:hypothetical protein